MCGLCQIAVTAPDLLGAQVEYVDISDRGPIEEWVRTGRYPGGAGPDRLVDTSQ